VKPAWLKNARWSAWLLAIAVAALGWVLHEFALGSGLVNLSYDLLHILRASNIPASEAVIVYLDEKSYRDLQQPQNKPLDRALYAQMIDRLTAAGARVIVMDVVFSDANGDESDRQLASAMKRSRRVIIGIEHVPVSSTEKKFIPPAPELATNTADYGSVEMWLSRDLILRAHSPNEQIASLSWAAAKFVSAPFTTNVEAEVFQPSTDVRTPKAWIHYYGPPGWLASARFSDALSLETIPDETFRGKTVFIGAKVITKLAHERNDAYRNPFTFWLTSKGDSPLIFGVEIQATMFLNLLRGDWLRRLPLGMEGWLIILFGIAAGYVLMRLKPLVAIGVAALTSVALIVVCRQFFVSQFTWFPFLIPLVQIGVALLCSVAVNSVKLYVENKLFVRSLELYLSPKLVKKFAGDKDRKLLKPGAEKQKLTILFSDIENFTALSEGLDSDELAKLMNEYFQSAVAQCVHPTDGTVVKYIGDSIFAFWNAPDPQNDHAVRACEAALRFRDQNAKQFRGKKLVTRLGLHTGVANVGNFGSETRVDYTAIGESINLASRMEGLNKFLGTSVLITGDTKAEIGDHFVTRYLGRFQLKGFGRTVEVHELLGRRGDAQATAKSREEFDYALQLFQQKDLGAAESAFERLLEVQPDDPSTRFYLKHIAEVRQQGVSEKWQGEVELKEK
jgi:adenylate cyclase